MGGERTIWVVYQEAAPAGDGGSPAAFTFTPGERTRSNVVAAAPSYGGRNGTDREQSHDQCCGAWFYL